MRKTCSGVFFLIFFLLGGAGGQASAATINLVLSDTSIYTGQGFEVEVWADAEDGVDEELIGFGFEWSLDTQAYITFTGYTMEGAFYNESLDNYNLIGFALPAIVDDPVRLATLYFQANDQEGLTTLSLKGGADAYTGLWYLSNEYAIDESIDILVSKSAGTDPVPEPQTLLLVGMGLWGFTCRRNLRKGGTL